MNVHYVHSGYRYRSPFGHLPDPEFTDACTADLADVIATATAGDVACFIAEPIQGVAGFTVPPDGFFSSMKKVLDEFAILYISDEVQTGWGRTGEHFWGYQAHGIVPDLLTFAKGLGNGLAIGGLVGRADLVDSVSASSISTFGGNPLATSAALANLDYLLSHDLQGNALARGRQLMAGLTPLAERLPGIGDLRGKGLMLAIEMVVPGTSTPDALAASGVLEGCRRRGVLVGKGGLAGHVLRIAPPLSVTAGEVDQALSALSESLIEVASLQGT